MTPEQRRDRERRKKKEGVYAEKRAKAADLSKAKKKYEKLNQEYTELRKQGQTLSSSERAALEKKIVNQEAKLEGAKAEIDEANANRSFLNRVLNRTTEEVESAQGAYARYEEELQKLKDRLTIDDRSKSEGLDDVKLKTLKAQMKALKVEYGKKLTKAEE